MHLLSSVDAKTLIGLIPLFRLPTDGKLVYVKSYSLRTTVSELGTGSHLPIG